MAKGKVPPQLKKFVKTKAQLANMGKGAGKKSSSKKTTKTKK